MCSSSLSDSAGLFIASRMCSSSLSHSAGLSSLHLCVRLRFSSQPAYHRFAYVLVVLSDSVGLSSLHLCAPLRFPTQPAYHRFTYVLVIAFRLSRLIIASPMCSSSPLTYVTFWPEVLSEGR
eukprot:TRINITY_DN3907_c0_g1_i1.p1 TRINITY_DN3907_c0_g1~~TRINITY_DN3907_c0_g1_i1.p1  ORF type:complete len:122 (-),score=2.52 TRINITY_DN3907_c0_g1_i1:463-828(-)